MSQEFVNTLLIQKITLKCVFRPHCYALNEKFKKN